MKPFEIAQAIRQEYSAAIAIGLFYRREGVACVATAIADKLQRLWPDFDRRQFMVDCGVPNG